MGLWTDLAEYVGPTPNHGGPMQEQRGQVEHIMAGTYNGSIAWGKNPASGVSFHFAVRKDGHIGQLLDTDITAWTQRDGNGHWVSVENEGYLPDPLTDAQIEANAKLYARGHKVYGWPLKIANSPTEYGLGHHSMGAENGYNWGHSACPGEAIKAQKQRILDRATMIVNGQLEDDDMPKYLIEVRDDGTERVVATNGPWWWWVRDASKSLPLFGQPFPTQKVTTAQLQAGFGASAEAAAVPLTPEELAAIEEAAKEGAKAGSPSHEELVAAANEAEDS